MRIIVGSCTVEYRGRGETNLPPAKRMFIIKDDNSVLIHSDSGIKPLNYMPGSKKNIILESSAGVFDIMNKQESLHIDFIDIIYDKTIQLDNHEPGLSRKRTEKQLQEWLSKNLSSLDSNLIFVQREYETGAGPVDLLAYDATTLTPILIEVKRVAGKPAVYQLKRYVESFRELAPLTLVKGILIAYEFKNGVQELCDKNNFRTIIAPE